MHFQEPVLTCNVALHDKSGIKPFYNARKKHVKSIQETIFYVIGRKIVVCFLWLLLPGDCRVTDEALLAETT